MGVKKWKTTWELKSLNFDELKDIILEVATKQLDDVKKENLTLDVDLTLDYDADSVDVVAMLLYLEEIFKEPNTNVSVGKPKIIVPTTELGQIVLLEDVFDLMYNVLYDYEIKMGTDFTPIRPNLEVLKKSKKLGELYN